MQIKNQKYDLVENVQFRILKQLKKDNSKIRNNKQNNIQRSKNSKILQTFESDLLGILNDEISFQTDQKLLQNLVKVTGRIVAVIFDSAHFQN